MVDATDLWPVDSAVGVSSITLNTGPLPLRLGSGDNTAGGLNTGRARVCGVSADSSHRRDSPLPRAALLSCLLSRACSHEELS